MSLPRILVSLLLHSPTILARSLPGFPRLPDVDDQITYPAVRAGHVRRSANQSTGDYRFYSNATAPYLVDALPNVPFPVGELYSGLVPIHKNDTSRQLFFVFKPSTGPAMNEVTIWLNGGPGCSSLTGFLQENGPWLWQPGTEPFENAYSWADVTNMLWVDQPVGTGFSVGRVKAMSEMDIAGDFVEFFRNWQQLFGIQNFKIYLTGESYAGRYIPYISTAMLDQNDKACFDVAGAMLFDPTIGQYTRDSYEVPLYPFLEANNNILNLNSSTLSLLSNLNEKCGYASYLSHYLQFPPPGLQPSDVFNIATDPQCWIQEHAIAALVTTNPCFSVYNIVQQCPILTNVLPFPPLRGERQPYFNRPEVKAAMHAPPHVEWSVCSLQNVFVSAHQHNKTSRSTTFSGPELNDDLSPDPIQHVLPRLIEATDRVLIANGDWDFLFPTNGTLLAIQNMTWHGLQGFQRRPSTPLVIEEVDRQYAARFSQEGLAGEDGPQGVMGTWHWERGLMWAETAQCGHMQPQYQPRVALQYLMWMLGRVDTL